MTHTAELRELRRKTQPFKKVPQKYRFVAIGRYLVWYSTSIATAINRAKHHQGIFVI